MLFRRRSTEQEFEAEALPHLDALFGTAIRLTGNRSEAEDLLQEVYLQAWKSFHRYEKGTNCRAWLFAILSNKLRHYRRKKATQKVFTLDSDKSDLLESTPDEPLVPAAIEDEQILTALEKVPHDYREAVLLADVQNFSYKEIAEITESPIGTVMSRISRGRKMLRKQLADYAKEYGLGVNDTKRSA